ncbi:hypothetical protein ABIB75_007577 [Bradyrhizobium sp. GM2.2]
MPQPGSTCSPQGLTQVPVNPVVREGALLAIFATRMRSWCLNDKPTLEELLELLEVQEFFDLRVQDSSRRIHTQGAEFSDCRS